MSHTPMFRRTRMFPLAAVLFTCAFTCCVPCHAGMVAATNPTDGNVSGTPGSTVGWGFDVTGDDTFWVSVTASVLLFESNPALGFYQDTIGLTNGPVDGAIPAGTDWSGDLGTYTIDPGAQIGDSDSGTIRILYDRFTDDPVSCAGTCLVDQGFVDVPVTVTAANAPEPSTWLIMLSGLALLLVKPLSRRLSGTSVILGAAAVALAFAAVAQAQGVYSNGRVLAPGCGALGQRPCNSNDIEYSGNSVQGNNLACDYGLALDPGNLKCDDFLHLRQHLSSPIGGWIGWALAEQEYSIGADQAINWIGIFGTHNSFSNPIEGGNWALNTDQVMTITDQLQAGARYVRLDPQDYSGQLRLCHSFSTFLCSAFSYGRLWAYGLQEIADWLNQHPGEFVVMRLHGAPGGFDYDTTINDILGSKIYKPNFWDPKVTPPQPFPFHFPALRELRASGKQIIILGDIGGGGSNAVFSWSEYVMDDGYTDTPYFGPCQNQDGQDIHARPSSMWSYIGEDRSGSNAFNSSPGAGLLDTGGVQHASQCGFGLTNVDFLDSLDQAYHDGAIPLVPFHPVDFRGPMPDMRRNSFIWSWAENDYGAAGPAVLNVFDTRWHGTPAGQSLPYACAGPAVPNGPLPDPDHPAGMDWQIAVASPGPWANGETACQSQFGSRYHFWAPASGFENGQVLGRMRSASVSNVWLNHHAGQQGVSIFPESLTVHYQKGSQDFPEPYLYVSGGAGGRLSASFTPITGGNFAEIGQPFANQFMLTLDPNALSNLPAGTYTGNVNVTEIAPLTNTYHTEKVPVTLIVTDLLSVSPASVDLFNNPPNSKDVTISAGTSMSFTYQASDSWITVSATGSTTPATLTISGNPIGLSKGDYTGTVKITAPNASNSPQYIQVHFRVEAMTTIVSNPSGLSFTLDGQTYTAPYSFVWGPGVNHTLGAPQTVSLGGPDTRLNFLNWSDAGALSHQVAGSNTVRQITLNYGKQYLVQALVNPPADGSVSLSPASTDGYYDSGTPMSIIATANNGFVFTGFSGDVLSHSSPSSFTADGPKRIFANFEVNTAHYSTTIDTSPTGLTVVVDGSRYTAPTTVSWQAGTQHTIGIPAPQFVQNGVQYTFTGWNDNGAMSHNVTAASQNGTSLIASFSQAYQLTVTANPSTGGSVTGAGFWAPGSIVSVKATPATNFTFTGFSGDIGGTTNPASITMNGPHTVTASFVGQKASLYASQGPRSDGASPGTRQVTLNLTSVGQGIAANAQITGIANITLVQGTGAVTLDSSTVLPAAVGTLSPGQSGSATLLFDWPSTATQVRFVVQFSANNGATTGSTTLTIFR